MCGSNFKQIGTAWIIYALDHDDWFPMSDGAAPFSLNGIHNKQEKKVAMADYYGGDGHIFYCPSFRSNDPAAQYTYEGRWDHLILTPVTTNTHFYAGMVGNDTWPNVVTRIGNAAHSLLAGDWTSIENNWANHVFGSECLSVTAEAVRGANWCFIDGHVEWTDGAGLTEFVRYETSFVLLPYVTGD